MLKGDAAPSLNPAQSQLKLNSRDTVPLKQIFFFFNIVKHLLSIRKLLAMIVITIGTKHHKLFFILVNYN